MAVTVTMPQLGESVTEGTISKWLKQPGEPIERYEPIAEVITDKVNAEVPAPSDGVMGELIAAEGATVPVGGAICTIRGVDEAAAAPAPSAPAPAPPPPPPRPLHGGAPASAPAAGPPVRAGGRRRARARADGPAGPGGRGPTPAPVAASDPADSALHVSPAVRMLAREHGVDLGRLSGSGLGGRITKRDILEWVQRRDSQPAAAAAPAPAAAPSPAAPAPAPPPRAPAAAAPAPAPAVPAAAAGEGDTAVPLTPMRKSIAEHMVRSVLTSPHAWIMVEVDMSAVAALRERHRAAFEKSTGVKLTYLPFVALAVIGALRRHPTLNATWTAEGILLRRDINLGIAVALEDSLVVPVIHHADRLSIAGLAAAARDLGDRAAAGKLRIEDIQGGTFTLNNAGALGTLMSQAIINQPQAGDRGHGRHRQAARGRGRRRHRGAADDEPEHLLRPPHQRRTPGDALRLTVRDTLQAMDERILG